MDTNHSKYSPEDFWPQAEEMLDSHFSRKRRLRLFKIISSVLGLLLLVGFAFYKLNSDEKIQSEKLAVQTSDRNDQKSDVEANGKLEVAENDNLNSLPESNGPETPEQQFNNDETSSEKPLPDAELNTTNFPNKEKNVSTELKNNNSNSNKNPAVKTGNVEAENNSTPINQEINNQKTHNNNTTASRTNLSKSEHKVELQEINNQTTNNNITTASRTSLSKSDHKVELNDSPALTQEQSENEQLIQKGNSVASKIKQPEIQLIKGLQADFNSNSESIAPGITGELLKSSITDSAMLAHMEEESEQLKNNKTFSIRAEAQAGVLFSRSTIEANANYLFMRPKNDKWSAGSSQEFALTFEYRNLELGTGLGINSYKINNSINPVVWGENTSIESGYNYFNDSSYSNQTNYLQGNEYPIEILEINEDSLIYYDTITTNDWKAAGLPENINTSNSFSYLEIPIRIGYRYSINSRWSVAARTAISFGFLQKAAGFVPSSDYSTWIELSPGTPLKRKSQSYRINFQLAWTPSNRWEFYLQPEFRKLYSNIWRDSENTKETLNSWGMQFGISFRLRP